MIRRAALLLLALTLIASTWRFPLFDVSAEQVARNQERWSQMSPDQKQEFRARWRVLRHRLNEQDEGERELRRFGSLNRLMLSMGDSEDRVSRIRDELDQLPVRLASQLPDDFDPTDLRALTDFVRLNTKRRMTAFLGNLAHENRLGVDDMAAFEVADWDGKVALALKLMKREALYFRAEFGPGEPLDALAPLDVVARQDALRRQRGLVGRAGRLLDLDPDDRKRLAAADPADFARAFDQIVRPAARRLLEQRALPPERIEELMAQPYRSLERVLERLFRSRR